MSSTISPSHPLLEKSAQLQMFVMFRRIVALERVREILTEHLTWMIKAEGSGRVFLSGPVTRAESGLPVDGLTIIRAANQADAVSFAEEDPFVQAKAITYEIAEWTINEGAIPLSVRLSSGTVAIAAWRG